MERGRIQVIKNCRIGASTKVVDESQVNLYDCVIGEACMIGPFVEIQSGVIIGHNVRVQSHSFICTGVFINNGVFIGHNVVFVNDKYPDTSGTWRLEPKDITLVYDNVSIGSGCIIMPGVIIGENTTIGAGTMLKSGMVIPSNSIVYNLNNVRYIIKDKDVDGNE